MRCIHVIAMTLAAVVGSGATPSPEQAVSKPLRCGIEMRNVTLHVQEGLALRVTSLNGEFVSRRANSPPVFDDPDSYTLQIASGEFVMDTPTLSRLLQEQVFNDPKSPISNAKLGIRDGKVHIEGRLRKGIVVPFSMSADVSASADGRMRLHASSLKAVGIPVKGMLDLFGVELQNLMKLPAASGIRAEGDDLLVDPFAMLPPPATEGRVKSVTIAGDRLVMTASGPSKPPAKPASRPDPSARNFMYFHGGIVTFGKLTMRDADLQLIDADPRDPFDFFPAHYSEQLVAGYSRNTARGGLRVLMPDYDQVHRSGASLKPPKVGR